MSWIPHITVASIVENNGKFLFVEEKVKDKKVLNQPAGHLEENESLPNACIRETLEETGCIVKTEFIVGVYQEKILNERDVYVRFCFKCKYISHNPDVKTDKKIIRSLWLTEEEIYSLSDDTFRSRMVLNSFNDYVKGNTYPSNIITYIE
ncbi:MAG: NUDIX hydrolase [Pseudomonadota bacterium]|nr:NUDIX hydrolase [Pseudomonadota bacterium]|tara:strand:- start:50 stop:499 length:450 start_codon:yes stop_codon:yes gene_type:complete